MDKKRKVLFLCLKNSARSQMAEAVLNRRDPDRFIAYSAGSEAAEEIHPFAYALLTSTGFDMTGKAPKNMEAFYHVNFDFIITLCDSMKEKCPVFPGMPIYAHWGMPDPAEFQGTEEETRHFFKKTLLEITQRINLLVSLPMEKLDRTTLERKVREIGETVV